MTDGHNNYTGCRYDDVFDEPAASGEQNMLKADFVPVPAGVWASDEVILGSMLTHKTEEDEVACVEVIAGKEGHVDYDMVSGVVYTHPEIIFLFRKQRSGVSQF